jgi:hypothetical protein
MPAGERTRIDRMPAWFRDASFRDASSRDALARTGVPSLGFCLIVHGAA